MKIDTGYTKKFIALSLILAVIILAIRIFAHTEWVNAYVWWIYVYMIVIIYGSHLIVSLGIGKTHYDVYTFFMLGTSVRLFLSALFIFIYFYVVKSHIISFTLNFFVLYFVYSFFEIKSLLLSLHPHSKSGIDK